MRKHERFGVRADEREHRAPAVADVERGADLPSVHAGVPASQCITATASAPSLATGIPPRHSHRGRPAP